jgi:hypothetical protein
VIDQLAQRFTEDVARTTKQTLESGDCDYLEGDIVDAVIFMAVRTAELLGCNPVSAYRLAFGCVSSVFLEDA